MFLEEVKKLVSMEQVISWYCPTGFLKTSKGFIVGKCPFHSGGGLRTFKAYPETKTFQCHHPSCQVKGDLIDFVANMEHCDRTEAAQGIRRRLALAKSGAQDIPTKASQQAERNRERMDDPVAQFVDSSLRQFDALKGK